MAVVGELKNASASTMASSPSGSVVLPARGGVATLMGVPDVGGVCSLLLLLEVSGGVVLARAVCGYVAAASINESGVSDSYCSCWEPVARPRVRTPDPPRGRRRLLGDLYGDLNSFWCWAGVLLALIFGSCGDCCCLSSAVCWCESCMTWSWASELWSAELSGGTSLVRKP